MNSKKAKFLRRVSKGMANSASITVNRNLIEDTQKRKYHYQFTKDEKGETQINPILLASGQYINDPQTIHGIYKNLKKESR